MARPRRWPLDVSGAALDSALSGLFVFGAEASSVFCSARRILFRQRSTSLGAGFADSWLFVTWPPSGLGGGAEVSLSIVLYYYTTLLNISSNKKYDSGAFLHNFAIIKCERCNMSTSSKLDNLIKTSQKGFRVDVVELAKKLDLPVYSVDLPEDESGHLFDGAKPYIEVNRNHPVTRQRFTVAHEISHFLKHGDLLQKRGQLDRKTAYANEAEIKLEEEADRTAACILMPKDSVERYFKDQNWTELTRFNVDMVGRIASEFRVSRELAVTRLRDLNIAIPYRVFA